MRILNRTISIIQIPTKVAMLILVIFRAMMLFKKPTRLLVHYIGSKPLSEKVVEFRDGRKIFLSSYLHDLITIMVIFCKREYGGIPAKGMVLDIGANIGVYSIFSILNGANRVLAFEPNLEAYNILKKNIHENGFDDSIIAVNLAVSDVDNAWVWIPVDSNPNNSIIDIKKNEKDGMVKVKTISLKSILFQYNLTSVDLMKIDYEGAEYKFIEAGGIDSFNRIDRIRFEYHSGTDRLTNHLQKFGFSMLKYYPDNERVGRAFYYKK